MINESENPYFTNNFPKLRMNQAGKQTIIQTQSLQERKFLTQQNFTKGSSLDRLKRANKTNYEKMIFQKVDYHKQKVEKLKNFFTHKAVGIATTKDPASENSMGKIYQFLRRNSISEEQQKILQTFIDSKEQVLEIETIKPQSQQRVKQKKERMKLKDKSKLRAPAYRTEENFFIRSQLIKKRQDITLTDERNSKASSSIYNLTEEEMSKRRSTVGSSFEQQSISQHQNANDVSLNKESQVQSDNEEQIEENVQEIELAQAYKEAIYQIKKNVLPQSAKKEKSQPFFQFIKNKEKIKELVQYFDMDDNQNPACFFSMNDQLFPRKFEIKAAQTDEKMKLDFTNMQLPDRYVPIVSNYLSCRRYHELKQLIITSNQLTAIGLAQIIKCIPSNLKELNLSNNPIGKEGCSIIEQYYSQRLFNLKTLTLQNNNIGDTGALILLKLFRKSGMLKKINLAENNLTDLIGNEIFHFLCQNKTIEVIILHWNHLGSYTGAYIARSLQQNKSLRVLDLSYNSLGGNDDSDCLSSWCILFQQDVQLTHLDISFNQFSEPSIRRLAEALNKNASIYGLHVQGNKASAYVDANGFIQFANQERSQNVQSKPQRINGVNYIPLNNIPIDPFQEKDCCWICQGWMEIKFQYTPGPSGNSISPPIFLHLDFLKYRFTHYQFYSYKPILMSTSLELKSEVMVQNQIHNMKELEITMGEIIYQLKELDNGEKRITMASINEAYGLNTETQLTQLQKITDQTELYFATYKMCPPKRRIQYFFSNPLLQEFFIAKDYQYQTVPIDDSTLNGRDPKLQHIVFSDGTKVQFQPLKFINFIETKQEYILDDKNDYKPLVRVYPRAKEIKYKLRKTQQSQLKKKFNLVLWQKENSIFNAYLGDTQQHIQECFEFDWGCTKIGRFVKNEYDRSKLKDLILENYTLIKDIYKYHSVIIPQQQDIFCFPFPSFLKFITTMDILDGENLKIIDVEIDLLSIKNNIEQKLIYNPDKALIRYQFMEMFFRLANDKYVRTGQCKQYCEAVLRLFKKDILPKFLYFDRTQQWREKRLWTRENDSLLRFKQGFLAKLYDYVTEITQRRWYFRLKWISLREFKEFMIKIDLMPELISDREVTIIYNFSMQTQIDETTQDRHIRMNTFEFLEALGRIAERISPCPMGENIEKWDLVQRQCLPLHVKLETFLTYIYAKINLPEFDQFSEKFSIEDPNLSMPKQLKIKMGQEKKVQHQIDAEKLKKIEQINLQEENQMLISVSGVLSYIELFKQPYVPEQLTTGGQENKKQILQRQTTIRVPADQKKQGKLKQQVPILKKSKKMGKNVDEELHQLKSIKFEDQS